MKSEKVFFIVVIVQWTVIGLSILMSVLREALSGENFSLVLLGVQLLSLILGSHGLYLLIHKRSDYRLAIIGITALNIFLTAFMLGIGWYLSGSIFWDITTVVLAFVILLGIWAFFYYFFVEIRSNT